MTQAKFDPSWSPLALFWSNVLSIVLVIFGRKVSTKTVLKSTMTRSSFTRFILYLWFGSCTSLGASITNLQKHPTRMETCTVFRMKQDKRLFKVTYRMFWVCYHASNAAFVTVCVFSDLSERVPSKLASRSSRQIN
eukprot:2256249-Amphidinium_carterae.1